MTPEQLKDSGTDQPPVNPRMSVVCILESGRPMVHGGPYMQAEAREIRDAMQMHVDNGNHSDWNLPRDTAHVVAITDDVLRDVSRLFIERIEDADNDQSDEETASEVESNE